MIPRPAMLLLGLLALAWTSDLPTDPKGLGERLCAEIDLAAPGMDAVAQAARDGRFEAALAAWRDAKVGELRRLDPGPFGWHFDQQNNRRLSFAELVVGRMDRAAYEAINPPTSSFFYERHGLAGNGPIDWLTQGIQGDPTRDYAGFYFAIPLAVRYWQSREPLYRDKFFAIAGDFVLRQRDLVLALPPAERKKLFCAWNTNAQSALSQGDRVINLVRCLALLAKSLPDDGAKSPWVDVLTPRQARLAEGAAAQIPADTLAQIALSLVHDHAEALCDRYLKAGAVPNQRRNGLAALLLATNAFPEFHAARTLRQKAADALQDYLAGMCWADGGMLEQSFNYNLGDAESLGQMATWLRGDLPALAADLEAGQRRFYRMMAALRTPLGTPPALSSCGAPNPPPIWRDDKARTAWFRDQAVRQTLWKDALGPTAFTSISFPYSGYHVQRGGWDWQAPWLFFQGSRPSRGHFTLGANALQVCAFGRPLLITAGVPVYDPGQLPVDLRPEFDHINNLLGESSSWKTNTLLVDGGSQRRPQKILQTVVPDPMPARVFQGGAIDYLEGTYEGGYTAPTAQEGISHHRQVMFLRDPGMWFVVDIVTARDGRAHTYQQNWILPGAGTVGRTTVAGFPDEAVEIQATARTVRTTDAGGPNLSLIQIGQDLTYAHQFGERDPWRGWFRDGFGGLVPAHQLQASFTATGSAVLITILVPRNIGVSQDPVVTDLHPRSDGTVAGCRIDLGTGQTATLEAATGSRQLRAGTLNADAQLILAVEGPAGLDGLVITDPGQPGSRSIHRPAQGAESSREIQVPMGFSWIDGAPTRVSYGRLAGP